MKDINQLISDVENLEDFELAAESLQFLKSREPSQANRLALLILANGLGDEYFQSFALGILYSVNRQAAFTFIESNIKHLSAYVFKTALESITEDSSLIDEIPEMPNIIKILNAHIESLQKLDIEKCQYEIDWFKKSFAGKLTV